ncbi:MAG: hypothetical protein NC082_05290 [Clostridiales bacterium]|nr:hypothetical protein [Clostridiales bacterium]
MENRSHLRLSFVIFCGIALLGSLLGLIQSFFPMQPVVSLSIHTVVSMALMGVVAWSLIDRRIQGLNLLGRIGGWAYVVFLLIQLIVSQYQSYLLRTFDYDQIESMFTVTSITFGVTSFLVIIAFALYLIGSRQTLPLKIVVPAFELCGLVISRLWGYLLGVSFVDFSYVINIFYVLGWSVALILAIVSFIKSGVKAEC